MGRQGPLPRNVRGHPVRVRPDRLERGGPRDRGSLAVNPSGHVLPSLALDGWVRRRIRDTEGTSDGKRTLASRVSLSHLRDRLLSHGGPPVCGAAEGLMPTAEVTVSVVVSLCPEIEVIRPDA